MGRIVHLSRDLLVRIAPAVVTLLALTTLAGSPGLAQPGTRGGASAPTPLDAGINAYNEGAIETAARSLSDALDDGNLSQTNTARALYYRGLAYRELGKPELAIADLTKAIAFKTLSKGDLKVAARNRAGAIREAGVATTATALQPGKQFATQVQVSPAPAPLALGSGVDGGNRWTTTSSIDAPKQPAPAPSSWGHTSVHVAPAAQ